MDPKYGEFVGVDSLHYAAINKDSESLFETATPVYLAPAAEIAGEPEVNNNTTYYDNKAANNYVTEGMTALTTTVSNIPAQLAAFLLGKNYDVSTGRVYDSGEPNPPEVALGFRFNMGKNKYRYYWYLKGTFSGGSEEAASKSNDVDIRTYQLTYTAVTTTHEWDINGEMKSLKRIFGDTADLSFDPTGWFSQVQTPDTVSAPAALALSNSNPADEGTGVAVDVSPTLTFNNKISDYNITVINKATLAVIAVDFSLDVTSKILTLNPQSNLDATTEYAIIISKVTDVYSQSISNTVINFTTA